MEPTETPAPQRMDPFSATADADSSRLAQHSYSNDTPTDVNPNAIVARAQMETLVLMGKNFEAGAARRNAIFDHIASKIAG